MTKYTPQSISGYNSNPPPDDGTAVAENEVRWSFIKEKIGDPVKVLSEALDTQLQSAFGKLPFNAVQTITTTTTLTASNDGKLQLVTNSPTINLSAASILGAGWVVAIYNNGSGKATIDPNGSETINGEATLTLTSGEWGIIICDGVSFTSLDLNGLGALALLDTVDTAQIDDDAVTLAKLNSGTADTLLGFDGSGDPSEITIGTGLDLTSGSLSNSGFGLGFGQTWQDLTSSRSPGVTYTNTTNSPIVVNRTINALNVNDDVRGFVDSVRVANIGGFGTGSSNTNTLSFVVPSGSTYRITESLNGGESKAWYELRE